MRRRTVIAFLLAPGLTPAVVLVYGMMRGFPFRESVIIAAIYAAFTYAAALVLGIPLHVQLDRSGGGGWWHYALGGIAAGLTVLAGFALIPPGFGWNARVVALFALIGGSSAVLFWAIAVYPWRWPR